MVCRASAGCQIFLPSPAPVREAWFYRRGTPRIVRIRDNAQDAATVTAAATITFD
jgi:hypothetical protein